MTAASAGGASPRSPPGRAGGWRGRLLKQKYVRATPLAPSLRFRRASPRIVRDPLPAAGGGGGGAGSPARPLRRGGRGGVLHGGGWAPPPPRSAPAAGGRRPPGARRRHRAAAREGSG